MKRAELRGQLVGKSGEELSTAIQTVGVAGYRPLSGKPEPLEREGLAVCVNQAVPGPTSVLEGRV